MTQQVQVQHTLTFADFTRPANTTAYTAADVIADSITAATTLTFSRASGEAGRGGSVKSALIVCGANQATKLNADLFLFTAAPATYGNDNEPFVPTDAEMNTLVGVVSLDGTTAANFKEGDVTVGAGGNAVIQSQGLDLPFQCAHTDAALYGVLVARNGYTPVSAETFRIKLGVQQG